MPIRHAIRILFMAKVFWLEKILSARAVNHLGARAYSALWYCKATSLNKCLFLFILQNWKIRDIVFDLPILLYADNQMVIKRAK